MKDCFCGVEYSLEKFAEATLRILQIYYTLYFVRQKPLIVSLINNSCSVRYRLLSVIMFLNRLVSTELLQL